MRIEIKTIRGQMVVKIVTIVCFFIFNPSNINCQLKTTDIALTGFRNFMWGSNIELVRTNEIVRYSQSFSGFGKFVLTFHGTFLDRQVDIDFTFVNDSLTQGAYVFESEEDNYKLDFNEIKRYLTSEYGRPGSRAGNDIDSDSVWIKISIYEMYSGPQYFWHFKNGFVVLHSAKDEDEITITVLFIGNKSIDEYLEESTIPFENYNIIE
ncbi:MAG: hypothetical protein A2V66_08860 [Ignavibacteria bacterium RBG_13_36_8]|nr:MAG: hypothetical protein A2V66_08860 [Ignavibacteria bacterium RBG_13_36_8]